MTEVFGLDVFFDAADDDEQRMNGEETAEEGTEINNDEDPDLSPI
jgi:hypothetical protein